MSGSFDLLGLSAEPVPREAPKEQAQAVQAAISVGFSEDEPVIAYPPAWQSSENVGTVSSTWNDPGLTAYGSTGADSEPGQKHFIVRCEGRWRVRSAPSLSSKVIGTIAHGTKVLGQDHYLSGERPADAVYKPAAIRMPDGSAASPEMSREAVHSISSLWVRVLRLEAQEPLGISEIKRDHATGGELYCLRRNAMGYGLYEADIEPLEGPLITLPENLAVELRLDAQRAASDKSEDVSLTWKLLGAAESVGRFFSSMAGGDEDEGGINEDMKPQARRRPEDVFEVKQREQLKKAAAGLRTPLLKLIHKASSENVAASGDLLVGLPKEVGRRFARLRVNLVASSCSSSMLVVSDISQASPAVSSDQKAALSSGPGAEGCLVELQQFVQLLERAERTGGWADVSSELRQEVINFSTKYARDLEDYARIQCKAVQALGPGGVGSPPGEDFAPDSLLGDLMAAGPAPVSSPKLLSFGSFGLAPPPPPSSSVGSLI
ncbi:unnamed protein product [Polarella glacialis]|uniref:Uncharacterized protein n=1 Tax=Polarella glacialis TaxID=89957 RepID=A0A813GKD8_POLGL|nr:unnamed protein product [Polarella glacialis]